MLRFRHSLLCLGVILTAAGCDISELTEDEGQDIASVDKLTTALTADAAQQIGPDGKLIIIAQADPAYIDEATALSQAIAYVHTIAPGHQTVHESIHGAPIHIGRLVPGERVYFAQSLYSEIEPERFPLRKALGPYYIVTFYDGQVDVLAVAVSAFNHDVSVREGKLILPALAGSDFVASAVPRGQRLTATPEESVIIAAREAGVLIRDVPTLIRNRFPGASPASSLWRVRFAEPSDFVQTSDRGHVTLDEVYVDGQGTLYRGVTAERDLALPAIYTRSELATSAHHALGISGFVPVRAASGH